MKRVFTSLLLLLLAVSINATDITLVSTPTDLGTDWSAFVDLRYADFSQVKSGDVLKINYTRNADGAQLQLQKAWAEYKSLETVEANGTWTLTIDDDLLAALNAKDDGVVIKGQNVTVNSVVVSTAEDVNTDIVLSRDPVDLGTDWSAFVDLRYCDYSKVEAGDVLQINYTAQDGAQIQLQKNWAEYKTYNELKAEGTIEETIDANLLAALNARDEGIVIKGQNAVVTSVIIKKATTAINRLSTTTKVNDNAYYTLAGQRVARPAQPGIYVHNGKKVLVK